MVTDFGDGCRSDKTRHLIIQICYIDIYVICERMSYIIYLSEICHDENYGYAYRSDKTRPATIKICDRQ